jgi:hypothetical protein
MPDTERTQGSEYASETAAAAGNSAGLRKIVNSSCPVHAWTTYILNSLRVQWGYGDDKEHSTHGAGCHVGCIGSCMFGWFVSIGDFFKNMSVHMFY